MHLEDRFWSKVVAREDGCWEWTAGCGHNGYGKFNTNFGGVRKLERAHRLSYRFFFGPIPEGVCVCHSCDNRRCINPLHLWLGTVSANQKDMTLKGRSCRGEKARAAILTEANVIEIRRLEGTLSQSKIGAIFGVSQRAVSDVLRGNTWKYLL